jgi:selenocysteine-specific elongation factor
MPKNELQRALGQTDPAVLDEAIRQSVAAGQIEQAGTGLRLRGHEVRLTPEQARTRERLAARALEAGFSPPTREALLRGAGDGAAAMLALLVGDGTLAVVGEHVYHAETLSRAKALLREYLASRDAFTVKEFRDLTGSTRKYVVPLLEHLDATGFTVRTGDFRRLGPAASEGASP